MQTGEQEGETAVSLLRQLLPLADAVVGRLQHTGYGVGDGGSAQLWSQSADSYREEHTTHLTHHNHFY